MESDRFGKLGGKSYEFFRKVFPHHDNFQEMVGLILKYYSTRKLNRVLDIGCGTGYTTEEIIKCGTKHVDAVDTSPIMLDKMKKWVKKFKLQKRVTLYKEFDYDKNKNVYDAVISVLTLHNLAEKERDALTIKMCQTVAPKGIIIIGDKLGIGKKDLDKRALAFRIKHVVGGLESLGKKKLSREWRKHYKMDERPGRKFFESHLIKLLKKQGFVTSVHYRLHQEAIVLGIKK